MNRSSSGSGSPFPIQAVLLLTLLLAASLVFSIAAVYYPLLPGDLELTLALQGVALGPLEAIVFSLTLLGERPVALALWFLAVGLLLLLRYRLEAAFLALTLLPDLVNILLKEIIGRPRPDPELVRVLEGGTTALSFPSGHAVHFMVFFGLLFYLTPRLLPGAWLWKVARGLLGAAILLVGPSRVYLGAHWPSDVVGGYLLGGLYLTALILTFRWVSDRRDGGPTPPVRTPSSSRPDEPRQGGL